MLYIDHIEVDKKMYAVADSDDDVIELVPSNEFDSLIKSGVAIMSWDEASNHITGSMNRKCNNHLYKKLLRDGSNTALMDYLSKYSVYAIAQKLNQFGLYIRPDRDCKIFSYSDTNGFFTFVLQLSDNSLLIVRISENLECVAQRIQKGYHFNKYPSISGEYLMRLAMRNNVVLDDLIPDDIYLLFYSNKGNEILLINHSYIGLSNNYAVYSIDVGVELI